MALISVSLAIGGGSIRMSCVVCNFRLTIILRRLAVRSKSYLDTEPETSKETYVARVAQPPWTRAQRIEAARQRALTSHLELPPPAFRKRFGAES